MLKFLRKKTKTIVWAVVISFTAWGGYAVSTQFEASNRSAGRMFGRDVSFRDFDLANRAVQIFAPSSDEKEPPKPEEVEARAWQFLILSREAKQRKITVTDDEVRDEIAIVLANGREVPLNPADYQRWVKAVFREEPHEFEQQTREQIRIRKLLDEVRRGFKENPEENLKKWLGDLVARADIRIYRPAA